ncbi:MAG: PEP/pyruvate-binding domain-containing protein [Thermodesulfobacteriota bacterium]
MNWIISSFRRLLAEIGLGSDSPATEEDLRAAFRTRYHNFRLLLTANNKALEIMTDLEKALQGEQPFGMSFVRSRSTAVCVNVFRIVKHLDEIAAGKYNELYDRFRIIQARINEALEVKKPLTTGELVLPFSAVDRHMVDQVGSKMANIAILSNEIDLPVPPGFVITSTAYERFLQHHDLQTEIDRRIQAASSEKMEDLYSLSAEIQQLVMAAEVPAELEAAIMAEYADVEHRSEPNVRVSLRSSALGEDVAGHTFAGQFRSELNVSRENILEAYKSVLSSKYDLAAMAYRLNRGIPDEEVAMCVGCMAMVSAISGGVMYSRDPLNLRDRRIFISSVWGLPKAVVDGSVDPDLFIVGHENGMSILDRQIKVKELQYICYPDEGVCRLETGGGRKAEASLTEEQVLELASIAARLEEYYGWPQDIEWAIAADGSIRILQCRALEQHEAAATDSHPEVESASEALIARGGVTASPGVAYGEVFIVKSDLDKLRFPDRAILVTSQSLPRWAPLLSRAVAVVTELGGVAGHLANVAREFGVAGLFGLPLATELLKNGDRVTVDADGLSIYRGRVEELLAVRSARKNLMLGSPVYEILQAATEHIVPLNLLDPDAPEFHPKKCESLHDITRFCHEKSVHEMFNFGKEHHFSERASKQLVWHVPMQWWIINLDDGFKEEVKGKRVHLDNITSIPMLAIWGGAMAVPWEGPPPVDAKGFMSVLVQATTNPALEPGLDSIYAVRNYFMISRNFCSLTSRFGFHFSTVEALVSERDPENYISFAFKGGAADYGRRVKRAMLIGQILEEHGFDVEVKQDSLFARLVGRDETYMKDRLKILGYLIMHTRQLDMVMSKDASVAEYRNKFGKDIAQILENPAAEIRADA